MSGACVVCMPPFIGGMVLLERDGNRACPGGVLFLATEDFPEATVFPTSHAALEAIDRSVRWHQEQYNYNQPHGTYVIVEWAPKIGSRRRPKETAAPKRSKRTEEDQPV